MTVDEQTRASLARLTANERECLRRRLLPQTAKEMAAELGISPHAVEKRLKMARTKLGLSSSLEAARLLAASDGYQPLVPHAPDLSGTGDIGEARTFAAPSSGAGTHHLRYQGLLMMMILALLAVFAQDVPAAAPAAPTLFASDGSPVASRKVDADEAAAFEREAFAGLDADHSGFLDETEAAALEPRDNSRDTALPSAPPANARDPAAERKWMDKLDHDRDGRVSVDEYVGYMMPWTLLSGVPAYWHPMR